MAAKKAAIHFESALAELENIVDVMESGDLELEEALKAFEKGIKLTRDCQKALNQAEQKISILCKTDGQPQSDSTATEEQPFHQDDLS